MDFLLTPEEARSTAEAVARYLNDEKFKKIQAEQSVDSAVSFRPTLSAKKGNRLIYVEAQHAPAYTAGVKELVHWVSVHRVNCVVYVAVSTDASLPAGALAEMKRDGVGLIMVDDNGDVSIHLEARNPALVVTPDPDLKLGARASVIRQAVEKFNKVDRKGGLQWMCEIVEGETGHLIRKLAVKLWIDKTEAQVLTMNWATQINVSASPDRYINGKSPVVDEKFKADLHSFRGARNLIDHPVTTQAAEQKRQSQFAERMLMGPRLVAELRATKARVR